MDPDFIVFGDFIDPEELKPKPTFIVFGDFLTPEDYLIRDDHPTPEGHLIRDDHLIPEGHLFTEGDHIQDDKKIECLPGESTVYEDSGFTIEIDGILNKAVAILAKHESSVCSYCLNLDNLELGHDSRIEEVFCESCRIIIGNKLQYQCPGRSQRCLKVRFIGPTGIIPPLCRECHQSAENRCHGGHINCLKFRYTDPTGNVASYCINCYHQESLLNCGYQPKARSRRPPRRK